MPTTTTLKERKNKIKNGSVVLRVFGRNVCQMKFNLELSLDILHYKSFIGQGKQK